MRFECCLSFYFTHTNTYTRRVARVTVTNDNKILATNDEEAVLCCVVVVVVVVVRYLTLPVAPLSMYDHWPNGSSIHSQTYTYTQM